MTAPLDDQRRGRLKIPSPGATEPTTDIAGLLRKLHPIFVLQPPDDPAWPPLFPLIGDDGERKLGKKIIVRTQARAASG